MIGFRADEYTTIRTDHLNIAPDPESVILVLSSEEFERLRLAFYKDFLNDSITKKQAEAEATLYNNLKAI